MALDTKLKSDMAGNMGGTSEATRSVVSPTRATTSSFTGTAETTIPKEEDPPFAKVVPPVSKPTSVETETTALLRSIEKQLKTLNQSVADLEQEVGSCKDPDYRTIFSKIDSARCSIERVVAGIGTTSSGSSDQTILDRIAELEAVINGVAEKQDRNDRQLAQTLRENANFQIQVRQGMQRDIDAFKEQQSGEQFNPILKEIASMYVEYQGILDDESISDLSRKNLKVLFEQFEDLLFDYDAEISRSKVGAVRQTRSTKIIGKVPTGELAKHNTVAVSRKPGVLRGRTVLYPEFVDVFVFDPSITETEIEAEETKATEDENGKVVEKAFDDGARNVEMTEEIVSDVAGIGDPLITEELIVEETSNDSSENE